jgi:putative hydrolase of the HAD superfamily
MIEAVLLDAGGVFHLPEHDRIVGAFARVDVQVSTDELDRAHYAGVAATREFREGDREIWIAYIRGYVRACGAPDDRADDAVETLLDEFTTGGIWSRIVPGSVDALRALAETGVRLAIVSNAEGTVEARMREQRICQVGSGPGVPIDAVIDSAVVGAAKPDPRIFEIALERLGTPAESAVHVGDTPAADVDGAAAAGIRPVLLDPYDFHTGLDVDRVHALTEVVDLVRAVRCA